MNNLILNAPKSAYGTAICDGSDSKVTFQASNGKTYTNLFFVDWMRYYSGKVPVKVTYSFVNRQPDIWFVFNESKMEEVYDE